MSYEYTSLVKRSHFVVDSINVICNYKGMDMSDSEKNAEKQRTFRQRQIDKGLMYVQVWVPAEKVEQVKEYAKRLRKD